MMPNSGGLLLLLFGAHTVVGQPPLCTFTGVGWCTAGANTPAKRADGEQVASETECWQRCTVNYGADLVAIDFWPKGLASSQ